MGTARGLQTEAGLALLLSLCVNYRLDGNILSTNTSVVLVLQANGNKNQSCPLQLNAKIRVLQIIGIVVQLGY